MKDAAVKLMLVQVESYLRQARAYFSECDSLVEKVRAEGADPSEMEAKIAEAKASLGGGGGSAAAKPAAAAPAAGGADAEALASDLDLKLSMAEMFAGDPDTAAPYIAEARDVLAQLKAASPRHEKVAEAEAKLAGMGGGSPAASASAAPASGADAEALASDLDLKLSMAEMFAGDPDSAAPYIAEARDVLAQLRAADPKHAKIVEAEAKLAGMGGVGAAPSAAAPASGADAEALASDLDLKLSMAEMFAGDPDSAAPYIAEAQGVLAQLKAADPSHAKVAEAEAKLAAMGGGAPASASSSSGDSSSAPAEEPPPEDETPMDVDSERPPKDDIELEIRRARVAAGASQSPDAHFDAAQKHIEALRAADAANPRIAEAEGELAAARLAIGKVQLDAVKESIGMHRSWIEASVKALDAPKVEKYAAAMAAVLEPQRAFLGSMDAGKALLAEGEALVAEARGKVEMVGLTGAARKKIADAESPLKWARDGLNAKNAANAERYWKDAVAKSADLLDPRLAGVEEVAAYLKQYREVEARIASELVEIQGAEEVKKATGNIESNSGWLASALTQKNAANATKYSSEVRKLVQPIRDRFGKLAAAAALLAKTDEVLTRCDAELPAILALEAVGKAEKDMGSPFGWVEGAIKTKDGRNARKYFADVQKAVAPVAEKHASDEKAQALLAKVAALGARIEAECPA